MNGNLKAKFCGQRIAERKHTERNLKTELGAKKNAERKRAKRNLLTKNC